MLKYRLIFGILMAIGFLGLMVFDGYLDGTLTDSNSPATVKGSILFAFTIIMVVPVLLELKKLFSKVSAVIFMPIAVISTMLIISGWYLFQFDFLRFGLNIFQVQLIYIISVLVISFWLIFFYQGIRLAVDSVIANCGANLLAILYLGIFAGFILGIRIDFGLWPLLMYIFTIKAADIGAYSFGMSFGKHKFSPKISPGKTWEGMAGAIVVSAVVGALFAHFADIMQWWLGAVFGLIFSFLGQFGDLAESMLKRDAQQKDASNSLPGFGGIMDVIDSPLLAAPAAYLFFVLTNV